MTDAVVVFMVASFIALQPFSAYYFGTKSSKISLTISYNSYIAVS